jgi:L-iditol 2-dehydrogenase
MRVARLYTIDDIRIEEEAIPEPAAGEILVRTRACGICTGDLMGWYMKRKAPLVFGHEPVGEVAKVGKGVTKLSEGARVFAHHHAPCGDCARCRRGAAVHCETWRKGAIRPGGMAEYFVVSAASVAADTLELPPTLDYTAASLVEPVACVVKSLRRGGVAAGQTIVVIGVGIMGQLHVALAAQAGARVIALDRVPFRLQRAQELGADAVVDVSKDDPVAAVRDLTAGEMGEVVFVGPGSIEAMETGIRLAGADARVVLFTCSQPDDVLAARPFALYFREVSLVPSYSCGPRDTREALALLDAGKIPVAKLVTHKFELEKVGEAMRAAADVGAALKTLVVFE